MSVVAYILVQTEVGKPHVAGQIAAIEGVTSSNDVNGPYDVIVRAEAGSMDDLARLIVSHIQVVEGVVRTVTCPVMNH